MPSYNLTSDQLFRIHEVVTALADELACPITGQDRDLALNQATFNVAGALFPMPVIIPGMTDEQIAEIEEVRASGPDDFAERLALGDHIEMEHEREVAPGTTVEQMLDMHNRMHGSSSSAEQFGHVHPDGDLRTVPFPVPNT